MKSLFRSGMMISLMTLISRVLGLVRDIVVARYFPVGGVTDAFFAAFRIPNLLRRLVGEGAFALAFVPVLTEYKETRSRAALKDLIDHVAGTLGIILIVITMVGVVAAPIVMFIFTPGFDSKADAEPELAVTLLRIVFPYILFISLSGFLSGILNTWGKFAVPAFTPVLLNVVLILSIIVWAPYFDQPIMALAWGVFIGGIAQLVFQFPSVYRLGLFPRPRFRKAHEGVKKILKLMVPALFGSSVAQINLLLNTVIASFLAVGSISWLYFSDRFVELPLALFGVAIGTVILPKLSADHSHDNEKQFSQTMDWATRLAIMVALPAMIGLIVLAKPILASVVYGSDQWRDVVMSSMSLVTYSLGLPAFILVKVLAPGFYSRQDTKTPVTIGIIAVFVNMVLNILIVLPWYLGGFTGAHAGLALSTALAGYANAGMLLIMLHRREVFSFDLMWLWFVLKTLLAACIMGAVIYTLMPTEEWWQTNPTLVSLAVLSGLIVAGGITYLIALMGMGISIKTMIKPKITV